MAGGTLPGHSSRAACRRPWLVGLTAAGKGQAACCMEAARCCLNHVTVAAVASGSGVRSARRRVLGEEQMKLVPKQPRQYVVVEPKWNIVAAGAARIVPQVPGPAPPRPGGVSGALPAGPWPGLSRPLPRGVQRSRNDVHVSERPWPFTEL